MQLLLGEFSKSCVCVYMLGPAGVTSLDFSQRNPHILGVGMHDGTIAVYDVRSRQPTPVLASTAETGKHADPVWKVWYTLHPLYSSAVLIVLSASAPLSLTGIQHCGI